MEHYLCCAHAHHDSLIHQRVAVEDALEIACVLDAEHEIMVDILEEEQAHRTQVVTLSQMQLQDMQKAEVQEKELHILASCSTKRALSCNLL